MNFDLRFLFLCCVVVQVQSCNDYFKCLGDMLQDYFVPKNVSKVGDKSSDNNTQLIDTQLNDNDTQLKDVNDFRNDRESFYGLSGIGDTLTQAFTKIANLIRDELNIAFNVDKEVDVHKNIKNKTIILVKAFSFSEKDNDTNETNTNSSFSDKDSYAHERIDEQNNEDNTTKDVEIVEIPNVVKNNLTEINDELSALKIQVENNVKTELDAFISQILDSDNLDWVAVPRQSLYKNEYITTEISDIGRNGYEDSATETPVKDVVVHKEETLITSETKAPIYTTKYPTVFMKSSIFKPLITDCTKNVSNDVVVNLTTTTKSPVSTTKHPTVFAKRKEHDEKKNKTKKATTKYVMITTHNNINQIRRGKSQNINTTSSKNTILDTNRTKEFSENIEAYYTTPRSNVTSVETTTIEDIITSHYYLPTTNEIDMKRSNSKKTGELTEQTTKALSDSNNVQGYNRNIGLVAPNIEASTDKYSITTYSPLLVRINKIAKKTSNATEKRDQVEVKRTSFTNKHKGCYQNTYVIAPVFNAPKIEVSTVKDTATSFSPLTITKKIATEREALIEANTASFIKNIKRCHKNTNVNSTIYNASNTEVSSVKDTSFSRLPRTKINEFATEKGDQIEANTTTLTENIRALSKNTDVHLSNATNIEASTVKDTITTYSPLKTTKINEITAKTSDPIEDYQAKKYITLFIKYIKALRNNTRVHSSRANATKIEVSTVKDTITTYSPLKTTKINEIIAKTSDPIEEDHQANKYITLFIKNIKGNGKKAEIYKPIFIVRHIKASTVENTMTTFSPIPTTKIMEIATKTSDPIEKGEQIQANATSHTKNIKEQNKNTDVHSSTSNDTKIEESTIKNIITSDSPLQTTKINEIETKNSDLTEEDAQIEAQTKTPINYNQHQPIDYKLIENFIVNEVGREPEDNSTDYPVIDYVELYKDTTNEPVEYIPTPVPKHYGLGGSIDYEVFEYDDTVDPSMLPWLAAIFIKNGTNNQFDYVCDGALLSDSTVLTAATCFLRPNATNCADDVIVFLGKRSLQSTGEAETIHKVDRVIFHDNLTLHEETAENDLALLLLENPAVVSESIAPACIGEGAVEEAYTSAWGANLSPIRLVETNKSCDSITSNNLFCATYRNEVLNCPSYGSVYYSPTNTTEGLNMCIYGIRTTFETRSGLCFHKDVTYTDLSRYKEWLSAGK